MSERSRAVVLLSGGVDSSTLLYQLIFEELKPVALAINYGQRHRRELDAAEHVARKAHAPFMICDIGAAMGPIFANAVSSQVGRMEPVPEGHYADASMKRTVVPNRNMLMLSIAGALAESLGGGLVAYAAHTGDHPIYPDCRPEFFRSCDQTLAEATDGRVRLRAPFGDSSKTDIVRLGSKLGVPFELTYSCYRGLEEHCGKCGTCFERREAFREAKISDPTRYALR